MPYFLLQAQIHNKLILYIAEEFLGYNEDEANLNISPEVVDIEGIIDDLKSVDNEEEDLYSPPPIPLITTAQARSHLTGLVQYLETLSVSELPGGAKPNLNVVVPRQQLQTLEQALTRNMHASRIQSIGFRHWSLLRFCYCILVLLGYYAVVTPPLISYIAINISM